MKWNLTLLACLLTVLRLLPCTHAEGHGHESGLHSVCPSEHTECSSSCTPESCPPSPEISTADNGIAVQAPVWNPVAEPVAEYRPVCPPHPAVLTFSDRLPLLTTQLLI